MSASESPLAPGTYRFTVRSPEQAVALIREWLGAQARVLSVRAVPATGWRRLFSRPSLEVVAEAGTSPPAAAAAVSEALGRCDPPPGMPARAPLELSSSEPATPFAPEGAAAAVASTRAVAPVRPAVPELGVLLRRSGFTETTLERLQSAREWGELGRLPLHRALAETSRLLRAQVEQRPERPALTRAAFLGGSGTGRTTALCKLLAQEVFRRGRMGHVVAVEFDRPNPLGPLPVFAEALGVPLAHFPCATRPVVPGGFVLLDLPALVPGKGEANRPLRDFLDREEIAERVLVLNAAYDRASLREAHATGRALGATHVIFTHLDEVPQWGKLWDYLFDEALEPLFLAHGPSLTADCEEDVTGAIARRTLPAET